MAAAAAATVAIVKTSSPSPVILSNSTLVSVAIEILQIGYAMQFKSGTTLLSILTNLAWIQTKRNDVFTFNENDDDGENEMRKNMKNK